MFIVDCKKSRQDGIVQEIASELKRRAAILSAIELKRRDIAEIINVAIDETDADPDVR